MFWFICRLFTAFPTLSSTLQRSLTSRQISAYSFARLCSRDFRHSRHADEGRVAAVEEGAVDDLQDEGEVLQRQEGDGGAEREQQALQRRQEEGEDGGLQVGVLLTLPCEQPPVQPSEGGGIYIYIFQSFVTIKTMLAVAVVLQRRTVAPSVQEEALPQVIPCVLLSYYISCLCYVCSLMVILSICSLRKS